MEAVAVSTGSFLPWQRLHLVQNIFSRVFVLHIFNKETEREDTMKDMGYLYHILFFLA